MQDQIEQWRMFVALQQCAKRREKNAGGLGGRPQYVRFVIDESEKAVGVEQNNRQQEKKSAFCEGRAQA
jgi:hypothetical protein